MQPDNGASLDDKSLRILFVLSSKQSLTIQEIARTVDLSIKDTIDCLIKVEHLLFIQNENDKYKITQAGLDFILQKGFEIPKPIKPANQPPAQQTGSGLFGTWQDMILLMLYFIATIVVFIGPGLLITYKMETGGLRDAIIIAFGIVWLVFSIISFKVAYRSVPEYERLVIFRLGKCVGAKGPGPILMLPFFDKPRTVDLRVKHLEVPHEACITQDNVQIDVDFVFYWRIEQPVWSITIVKDGDESIRLLATALLRAVIAHYKFNDALKNRESINDMLKQKIDDICKDWGIYVTTIEIREIKPPEEIVKSMHKQREAEWYKQATVTNAEAQADALKLLFHIASTIDDKTLSLKYFEMLKELGQGESTKFIFPLELTDLVRRLQKTLTVVSGNPATIIEQPVDKSGGS